MLHTSGSLPAEEATAISSPWEFASMIIAFDEGRTLPNLLGYLWSRRFPVHASESWPVFFRSIGRPAGRSSFQRHFEWRHNFVAQRMLPGEWRHNFVAQRMLPRASQFLGRSRTWLFVGEQALLTVYCCLIGKLFCYVVEQFLRCNLSRPEESVCHFWTLYINQNVVCSERFAMFDRTDPLRSQNKSAK